MEIDDTDRQVINALLRDGRASATDVASATGVAATTVQRRIDRLEDGGAITGYEPRLDYERLGFDVTAVFQLTVEGDALADLTERLSDHDRMTGVYEVTGDHDVVAVGKFRTTDEMNERIKQLLTDAAIREVSTAVVLETVQEHGQFQIDAEDV